MKRHVKTVMNHTHCITVYAHILFSYSWNLHIFKMWTIKHKISFKTLKSNQATKTGNTHVIKQSNVSANLSKKMLKKLLTTKAVWDKLKNSIYSAM